MYLILKSLHLIFVIAWFAELFYIFRLFVYHVKHENNREMRSIFETMEYKLIYYIGHPAMLLTILFGALMIYQNPIILAQKWLHLKFLFIGFLIGYQIFCGITRRKFAEGNFFISEKACRFINEVPTLLLIVIVLLAILKPL